MLLRSPSVRRALSTLVPYNPPLNIVRMPASSTLHDFAYTHQKFARGNLPKVVMIHGGPGSHKDFKYLNSAWLNLPGPKPDLVTVDLPGYGESTPKLHEPSADNFAALCLEGLETAGVKPPFIVVGHSLGGHVALSAAQHSAVVGVGFCCGVSVSEHHAVKPFKVNKALGEASKHPLFKYLTIPFLSAFYRLAGFPSGLSFDTIAYVHQRIAALNFAAARQNAVDVAVPWVLLYTLDDHLIESPIFKEMAMVVGDGAAPGGSVDERQGVVVEFEKGGHNIQKTQAAGISEAIVAMWRKHWVPAIL